MTPPRLVARHEIGADGDDYVTDADAQRLEAVVEAADEMRAASYCESAGCDVIPGSCRLCKAVAAFDTARRAVVGPVPHRGRVS